MNGVKGLLGLEAARRAEIEAARRADADAQAAEVAEEERVLSEMVYPLVIEALVRESGLEAAAFEDVVDVTVDYSCPGESEEGLPRGVYVGLNLPEHTLVQSGFMWDEMRKEYIRRYRWEIEGMDDEYWRWPNALDLNVLANALVVAREVWEKERQWAAEEEVREARAEVRRQEQAAEEQSEWDELVGLVSSDPVVLGVVRLLAAVQRERDGLAEQVESLEYVLQEAETAAEQRAAELEREVEGARAEAQDYQQRAWDAEEAARRGR